jgi:putative toxin-antitoxin system antitoxin component (TIGR02293 family)
MGSKKSSLLKKRMASPRVRPVPVPATSLDKMLDRATEIIGDREEALRWLGTPVRALNFATPVSQLATSQGKEAVESVLTRLEHGVF